MTFSYAFGERSNSKAFTSVGVGGSPVRSSDTRRNRRARSASGDGESPSRSSLAIMNASIGFFTHIRLRGWGIICGLGGTKDQCDCHSAPCEIHCLMTEISFSVSGFLPDANGGIRIPGFSAEIRLTISLFAGSPGITGVRVPRAFFAPSSRSSRRPTFRLDSSGPWQEKHRSDRMDRTSLLKSTLGAAGALHVGVAKQRLGRSHRNE